MPHVYKCALIIELATSAGDWFLERKWFDSEEISSVRLRGHILQCRLLGKSCCSDMRSAQM